MSKKIYNIIIILVFSIAIALMVIGGIKIYYSKYELKKGIEEIEDILKSDSDKNINDNVEDNESTIDEKAIGIIKFKLKKEYKIAIYDNVTENTLSKGCGRATGTSNLNEKGNCVLYGHRDSAFRPLWDIKKGDRIEITTKDNTLEYEVRNIYVTTPDDPKIFTLADTTVLTLVTCYPFVYAGPANQRCIVECVAIS